MHLTGADPAGIERFLAFLRGPCRSADRIVLLGDLFEFWVSPHQRSDRALRPVLDELASLARGREVGFVEGNRDFEAAAVLPGLGVARLPETIVVEAQGTRVVATHGDLLCTRDLRYLAYRRLARAGLIRHLLRVAPERVSLGVGETARAKSRKETAKKPYGDMGLDPAAVASLLRRADADALVCGHVHWGRRFTMEVDALPRDVVVLGAWEDQPTYAVLGDGGLRFHQFGIMGIPGDLVYRGPVPRDASDRHDEIYDEGRA